MKGCLGCFLVLLLFSLLHLRKCDEPLNSTLKALECNDQLELKALECNDQLEFLCIHDKKCCSKTKEKCDNQLRRCIGIPMFPKSTWGDLAAQKEDCCKLAHKNYPPEGMTARWYVCRVLFGDLVDYLCKQNNVMGKSQNVINIYKDGDNASTIISSFLLGIVVVGAVVGAVVVIYRRGQTGGALTTGPADGMSTRGPTNGTPTTEPTGGTPTTVPTGGTPTTVPTDGTPINEAEHRRSVDVDRSNKPPRESDAQEMQGLLPSPASEGAFESDYKDLTGE